MLRLLPPHWLNTSGASFSPLPAPAAASAMHLEVAAGYVVYVYGRVIGKVCVVCQLVAFWQGVLPEQAVHVMLYVALSAALRVLLLRRSHCPRTVDCENTGLCAFSKKLFSIRMRPPMRGLMPLPVMLLK